VTVANGASGDTAPPTVAVVWPSSGATLAWTVTVIADASDNVGVAGVEFLVDGAPVGAQATAEPNGRYWIAWDTTTVPNGSHALAARARDAAGNTTTSTGVPVTVANGVR
jgi:hypothetical protein